MRRTTIRGVCYSAQISAQYQRFVRQWGAVVDLETFTRLYFLREGQKKARTPKAMDNWASDLAPTIREAVAAQNLLEVTATEQELFKQNKRVADAERTLQSRVTKKAQEDLRIGLNKVALAKARLATLKRSTIEAADWRFYPGEFVPVMVMEHGRHVIKPMRYQCRLPGWSEQTERQYPGTYNARRDKLAQSWSTLFGHRHGVLCADAFFEHVQRNGRDVVLEFSPQTREPLLVACLWNSSQTADGPLLTFAAITDEPPPEVADAGHDRCVVPLKPVHVDAWLNPDPANLSAMLALLDDRERPYYEHREAA